ncbi:MAG: bacteriohemerythrin [Planctomycetota bacterium]
MSIVWSASFATGSPEVDRQHQELIRQIGALSNAMKAGKGRDELKRMLDFLGQYVVQHFRDEERVMEQFACPAAARNKQEHAKFLALFQQLNRKFESGEAQVSVLLEIHDTVTEWLLRHIKGVDLQLAQTIRQAQQAPVGAGAK